MSCGSLLFKGPPAANPGWEVASNILGTYLNIARKSMIGSSIVTYRTMLEMYFSSNVYFLLLYTCGGICMIECVETYLVC